MKLTLLGSASGWAVPHRNASAMIVEAAGSTTLIDAGECVTQQLLRNGFDPNRIENVLVSHTHADHAAGLFGLLMWMYLAERSSPLSIYLPRGIISGFETIFPFFHIYQEKWPFHFLLKPIDEGDILEGPCRIIAFANHHLDGIKVLAREHGLGSDSYSFQITEMEGRKVIYTSDVDSLEHLRSHAMDVHTLISECSHIRLDEIRALKNEAGIEQVILTHIPPEKEATLTEQSKALSTEGIHLASDGFVIEV